MIRRRLVSSVLAIGVSACGDGRDIGPYGDYEEENVTVLGSADETEEPTGEARVQFNDRVDDGDCADLANGVCVNPDTTDTQWCEREGGPVDVIIVDGEVVDVICYPPSTDEDRPVDTVDGDGDIDVAQNANRTTVVFNDELDGTPIVGDLSVDGNNVAIYGNGVEDTIIDGDVTITGNNARLRALTITGDLRIELNSAAVVLVRVLGNVVISKNNSVFAESDVFGNLVVDANNVSLIGNDVQGTLQLSGLGFICDANRTFEDLNADEQVSDDERADEVLECGEVLTTP